MRINTIPKLPITELDKIMAGYLRGNKKPDQDFLALMVANTYAMSKEQLYLITQHFVPIPKNISRRSQLVA